MRKRMRLWPSLPAIAVPLLLVFTVLGCGEDELPREAISGTVSVDGKPLKTGVITFVPNGADIPTQAGAAIVEGKYSIEQSQGLVPGKYKAVVSSGEGSPEKQVDHVTDMPGMPPIPAKEVIPPQYGSNSILEATVTAGGKNQFDFNIVAVSGGK